MFELALITCVGLRVCEYQLSVPTEYESLQRCSEQAAILAGMVHGRYDPRDPLSYRFLCKAKTASGGVWIDVGPTDDIEQTAQHPAPPQALPAYGGG